MNQEKIGRFIAQCRKENHLTQRELAERLNITDRAVSKWETGKALPDSSIMLEVCQILHITVNDLLSGERVTMENYRKEVENNLLEMVKQKEQSDRRLLAIEWVVGILSIIVLLVPVFIAAFLPMEDWLRILLVVGSFIPCMVGIGFALRIEQVAGYYQCAKCRHRYVPTYGQVFLAAHVNRTRYMKCPQCQRRSWNKKVLTKE